MNRLRGVVEDHWHALDEQARPSSRGLTISVLPVRSADGDLVAGRDGEGRRHLLVPVAQGHTVEPDLRSAGVHLVARDLLDAGRPQRFADLVLLDSRLGDVFTSLCADVIGAVEVTPDRAVHAVLAVLDAWRTLLDAAKPPLGLGAVAGLFGELVVLERMLALDPGAVSAWTGPLSTAQDFYRGSSAVEVKSTTTVEGYRIRVHGLDQLDGVGRLWLAWFRLDRHPGTGRSLSELVRDVRDLVDDERHFLTTLAATGYVATDPYAEAVRFTVLEERWYEVDAGFPRLRAADLVKGPALDVLDVHYTVDLDGVTETQLDVPTVLSTFLGDK